MKAISLWDPWAFFVAVGAKTTETRSWPTSHRGELAICAAKTTAHLKDAQPLAAGARSLGAIIPPVPMWATFSKWPGLGCVVAVVDLVDCFECGEWWRVQVPAADFLLGDLSPGRFAWVLRDVRRLERPVPVRGFQGLFNLPADVERAVVEQIGRAAPAGAKS